MAMKSSSVCALEPEKITKNKVGPIIWDTLYIVKNIKFVSLKWINMDKYGYLYNILFTE